MQSSVSLERQFATWAQNTVILASFQDATSKRDEGSELPQYRKLRNFAAFLSTKKTPYRIITR